MVNLPQYTNITLIVQYSILTSLIVTPTYCESDFIFLNISDIHALLEYPGTIKEKRYQRENGRSNLLKLLFVIFTNKKKTKLKNTGSYLSHVIQSNST